jgi:activator of HSP90 ATPase
MASSILDRRAVLVAVGGAGASLAASAEEAPSAASLGVSRDNAAIHQEVVFAASATQVYELLTQARQFDKVVALSKAMKSMSPASAPCEINAEAGAAFSLFGGYITGRQIELTPNVRIIQAWRSAGWPPHDYSIARFELVGRPDGVRLVFDHTGFPSASALSLATGWQGNYWAPMTKVLASG